MTTPSGPELDPTILIEISRGADESALADMGHAVPEGIAETVIYVSKEETAEELEGLEALLDDVPENIAPGLVLTPEEQARFKRLNELFDSKQARKILGIPPDAEILN